MKFIKKYESCIGLSLPPIGRWKLEFWYCKPNYKIQEHSHNSQDIKLIPIFCHNVRFHRKKQSEMLGQTIWATWKYIGTVFNIRAGNLHYFSVSNWPLIFLNIEHWKKGVEITSACDDLHLTTESKKEYARS